MSGTPKNSGGNPILGPGFPTALNVSFLTGNTEIAVEIQMWRQVLWTENQILIVVSSPALTGKIYSHGHQPPRQAGEINCARRPMACFSRKTCNPEVKRNGSWPLSFSSTYQVGLEKNVHKKSFDSGPPPLVINNDRSPGTYGTSITNLYYRFVGYVWYRWNASHFVFTSNKT